MCGIDVSGCYYSRYLHFYHLMTWFLNNEFMFLHNKKKRIYLDYAAATPLRPSVIKTISGVMKTVYGNPSAVHTEGVIARKVIEDARSIIANTLKIKSDGVYFTSGGTEANNLAIFGAIEALHTEGREYEDIEIISTEIEHPSIIGVLSEIKKRGVTIKYAPVSCVGKIIESEFLKLLSLNTALVTCGYVNSEIGVVQDIKSLSRHIRKFSKKNKTKILFHIDAAQAPLWLSCDLSRLGIDMISLDTGKCYGPKGFGLLACHGKVDLLSHMFGGGQEVGIRPGTENTPLIAGGSIAIKEAQDRWEERSVRIKALRDYLITQLEYKLPEAILNGPNVSYDGDRVANNVNFSIKSLDTEFATIVLDNEGIAVSTKSACGGSDGAGSYVVRSITKDKDRAQSTLRITLGEETTIDDLDRCVEVLVAHCSEVKNIVEILKKN